MLFLLLFIFLSLGHVLELYSHSHMGAIIFGAKGKAKMPVILAVYNSTNYKCKRRLEKMNFEDRWIADNFLLTATHDYGMKGSDLKTIFQAENCPQIVFIPKESSVRKSGGEMTGFNSYSGEGELSAWVKEQINVKVKIVNEFDEDIELHWYQGKYKLLLKKIEPYRMITISVFISQFYVAHKVAKEGEEKGEVVYRFFATGESKVHVLSPHFCAQNPKECQGSDSSFRKRMKKKWKKEIKERVKIQEKYELMWSQPPALTPLTDQGYDIIDIPTNIREELVQTVQRLDIESLNSEDGSLTTVLDKKDKGLKLVDKAMKRWLPQLKLRQTEANFYYYLSNVKIPRHIRDADEDVITVIIPVLVEQDAKSEDEFKLNISLHSSPAREGFTIQPLTTTSLFIYESGRFIMAAESSESAGLVIVRYNM